MLSAKLPTIVMPLVIFAALLLQPKLASKETVSIEIPSAASINTYRDALARIFEERSFTVPTGPFRGQAFGYRLFVPPQFAADPTSSYPMLVWLHGYGENGDDNESQLRWLELVFTQMKDLKKYPFFVLAVQCPKNFPAWYLQHRTARNETNIPSDPIDITQLILDGLLLEYGIEKNRLVLSGVSSGADGCWEMAIRYPGMFQAIAPLGSHYKADASELRLISHLNLWAFHATDDPDAPVEVMQETISNLKSVGGSCMLTEISNNSHDCWTAAFKEYDVLGWLLSQTGHGRYKRQLGTVPLPYRLTAVIQRIYQPAYFLSVLAVCLIALIVVYAIKLELIRHRTSASNESQS